MIDVGDLVKVKDESHDAISNRRDQTGIILQIIKNIHGAWAIVMWSNEEVEAVSMKWIGKVALLIVLLSIEGCTSLLTPCHKHPHETIVNFCMAERTSDGSYCEEIDDHVFRVTCYARMQRRERVCYDIEDTRGRDWCLLMLN